MFDIWHRKKPHSSLTLNTIPSCARGAVQNEQICGIVCDYKQISSGNEARYALFPSNLQNTRIVVLEMRSLPL